MNWLNTQVNLYRSGKDLKGKVRTLQEIIFSDFGANISDIVALRKLDHDAPNYKDEKRKIKDKLQMHTVAALLTTRGKDVQDRIKSKTGLTQIDLDKVEEQGFDIEEMKQFLFSFPFTCFVSKSCSGDGIYAIIAIDAAANLKEAMQHLAEVFTKAGINIDTSKGGNLTDCRYVSYDANMLWREDVEPLKIKRNKPVKNQAAHNTTVKTNGNNAPLIASQVQHILNAQIGQRWQTVQRAAYTLGGIGEGLEQLEQAIFSNPAFEGETSKYLKCLNDCYQAGTQKKFFHN